jgi:hypothetical protein
MVPCCGLFPALPVPEDIMATATATPPARTTVQPREYHPMAGVLSYLVPGLGQIMQGRVAKGVLFLICIYALFFYGIYLGTGSVTIDKRTYRASGVVYLPDVTDSTTPRAPWQRLATNLYNRPQFAGQFWVGVAAWPAIVQYLKYDHDAHQAVEDLYNRAEGVQLSDPERAQDLRDEAAEREKQLAHPLLGSFEREPSQASLNAVHNAGDKRLELAWVFTVIAGVLNILVIYDAVAGPAHALTPSQEKKS